MWTANSRQMANGKWQQTATDARHGRLFLVIVVRGIQLKELGYNTHEKHENCRKYDGYDDDDDDEACNHPSFGGLLLSFSRLLSLSKSG
jgi:hypothetical protein